MQILISGGSGFIGQALVDFFSGQGYQLTVIGRDINKLKKIFKEKVNCLDWDSLGKGTPKHVDVIINLAGENIASGLWTSAKKHRLHHSRITATMQLVQFANQLRQPPECFISASGISIYPSSTEIYTEDTPTGINPPPSFMGQLAWDWEQAVKPLQALGIRVVNLRLAPVLGISGGMLKQLLLPYKLGLGGRLGSGHQPFPWVALPDVVRGLNYIIKQQSISGPVNMIAPELIDEMAFAKALAAALHRPCFMAMPDWLLKKVFGEMAEELLLGGVKATPAKLLQADFEFEYPTIEQALQGLL